MWKSVVFVPSAPVLVPDVAGPGAVDVYDVRDTAVAAIRDAVAACADERTDWLAIGTSAGGQQDSTLDSVGTFAGFGVDRRVSLASTAAIDGADAGWPTSMLLAGWYRESAGADRFEPLVVDAGASVEQLTGLGASLRRRLLDPETSTGLCVVGDGATSLSPRAPGGSDQPAAHALQDRIDAALGAGDAAALANLPVAECDRWDVGGTPAWQLIGTALAGERVTARLSYAGAPFGVGYTVATWTPLR